jgi:hypothetical protein
MLYFFYSGKSVFYIGRTTQTLSKRFLGDHVCGSAVRKLLAQGKEVRILVLPGRSPLSWESFPIDLAAGLEAALVKAFAPPWNKSKDGRLATATESDELADKIKVNKRF